MKTSTFSIVITALITLCCMPCSSHAGINPAGLIAYFNFDSDSAADTSDALGGSASTNDGSWTGSAVYKDGAFGRAAEIGDGAGSNFITSSGAEYDFGADSSFTVVYWLNTENAVSGDPSIVAGGGKNWSATGAALGWVSAMLGDDLKANVADGSNRGDTGYIDIDHDTYWAGRGEPWDHWNFVVMVVDREAQTLTNYAVDEWVIPGGKEWIAGSWLQDFGSDSSEPTVSDISNVGDLTAGNLGIVMGQDGDGAGYSLPASGIDDVSIWSRALTRAELWEIYAEGRAHNKPLSEIVSGGLFADIPGLSAEAKASLVAHYDGRTGVSTPPGLRDTGPVASWTPVDGWGNPLGAMELTSTARGAGTEYLIEYDGGTGKVWFDDTTVGSEGRFLAGTLTNAESTDFTVLWRGHHDADAPFATSGNYAYNIGPNDISWQRDDGGGGFRVEMYNGTTYAGDDITAYDGIDTVWSTVLTADSHNAYANGTNLNLSGSPTNSVAANASIIMGAYSSSGYDFVGNISQMIIFESALSDADRALVEGFLGVGTEPSPMTLTLDKASYTSDEDVVVSWTNAPLNAADWIGIYPRGVTPGDVTSSAYLYVNGDSVTFTARDGFERPTDHPGVGQWTAWYLLKDGYDAATAGVDFDITAPVSPMTLTLDKASYAFDEDVVVSWTDAPGNAADWIGIYPRGATPGPGSSAYLYVSGDSVTFTAANLPGPGAWTAWYLLDDGYDAATAGVDFEIGAIPMTFSLDKASYTSVEDVVVSWGNAPGNTNDWIGIYPSGVTPSSGSSGWMYAGGTADGSVTFSPSNLPGAGDWTAWYLLNDGYTPATAGVDFSIVNLTASIVSFTSSSDFIADGPVTLSWSLDDAGGNAPVDSLTISDGLNPVDVTGQSELVVNPAGTTEYTLSLNDGADTRVVKVFKDAGNTAAFFLDKTSYTTGEKVVVSWADVAGGSNDWIGLYKAGDTPGSVSSTLWTYLNGTQTGGGSTPSGSFAFEPLPKGDYFVVLLLDDGYTVAEGPILFTVAEGSAARFEVTQISYDPQADQISLTWTSRPNQTYAVSYSGDEEFEFNGEVNDSVSSDGDTTTLTFASPVPGSRKLYFRVSEN